MHPREVPNGVQSRRKAQAGWWPGEHLQRRVGAIWGLTLRAGVAQGTGVGAARSPGVRLGKGRNARLCPVPPRPEG